MSEAFSGFRPEAIDFLWQLRFNNNRDWFSAHKQTYLEALYRPLVAFSEEIFTPFAGRSGYCMKVSASIATHGFAHAAPYKEPVALHPPRRDVLGRAVPVFEITPEGYNYGFVLWGPPAPPGCRPSAQGWRQSRENFLPRNVRTCAAKTGLALTGDRYKAPKAVPRCPACPWWNLKNLMAISRHPVDDGLYDTALPPVSVRPYPPSTRFTHGARAFLPIYPRPEFFCQSSSQTHRRLAVFRFWAGKSA